MTQENGTRIRPLTNFDTLRLHVLISQCYEQYGMTFSLDDPAESHLIDPVVTFDRNVWCIDPEKTLPDGALLASAALSITRDRTAAEIKAIYVHPSARRQGLGRRMTQHCIDHAVRQSIPTTTLWSDTRFTAAHALYASMGFQRTGERKCFDLNNSREFGYRWTDDPTHRAK